MRGTPLFADPQSVPARETAWVQERIHRDGVGASAVLAAMCSAGDEGLVARAYVSLDSLSLLTAGR